MIVLFWTRSWHNSFYFKNELILRGYRVISITDEDTLSEINLSSLGRIYLYWPEVSQRDTELCTAIRKIFRAEILLISRQCEAAIARLLADQNIQLVTDPVEQLFVREGSQCSGTKIYSFILRPLTRSVRINNREIDLSPREFRVLQFLYERMNTVIGREEFIDSLWDGVVSDSNLYTTIQKIRGKIEENPLKPKIIQTKKGGGYIMSVP
ncbi:MAG: hypothetical protein K0R67_1064 [Paenibacillus sp.]|jgi:hypothetical protein|nr:hypothetical protein [Paenibacillus sp.]